MAKRRDRQAKTKPQKESRESFTITTFQTFHGWYAFLNDRKAFFGPTAEKAVSAAEDWATSPFPVNGVSSTGSV